MEPTSSESNSSTTSTSTDTITQSFQVANAIASQVRTAFTAVSAPSFIPPSRVTVSPGRGRSRARATQRRGTDAHFHFDVLLLDSTHQSVPRGAQRNLLVSRERVKPLSIEKGTPAGVASMSLQALFTELNSNNYEILTSRGTNNLTPAVLPPGRCSARDLNNARGQGSLYIRLLSEGNATTTNSRISTTDTISTTSSSTSLPATIPVPVPTSAPPVTSVSFSSVMASISSLRASMPTTTSHTSSSNDSSHNPPSSLTSTSTTNVVTARTTSQLQRDLGLVFRQSLNAQLEADSDEDSANSSDEELALAVLPGIEQAVLVPDDDDEEDDNVLSDNDSEIQTSFSINSTGTITQPAANEENEMCDAGVFNWNVNAPAGSILPCSISNDVISGVQEEDLYGLIRTLQSSPLALHFCDVNVVEQVAQISHNQPVLLLFANKTGICTSSIRMLAESEKLIRLCNDNFWLCIINTESEEFKKFKRQLGATCLTASVGIAIVKVGSMFKILWNWKSGDHFQEVGLFESLTNACEDFNRRRQEWVISEANQSLKRQQDADMLQSMQTDKEKQTRNVCSSTPLTTPLVSSSSTSTSSTSSSSLASTPATMPYSPATTSTTTSAPTMSSWSTPTTASFNSPITSTTTSTTTSAPTMSSRSTPTTACTSTPSAMSSSATTIRKARLQRVQEQPQNGALIKVNWCGTCCERKFKRGSCFQEVYDWIGSESALPLHFELRRPIIHQHILHDERIQNNEMVILVELTEEEELKAFNRSVSLQGDFVYESVQNDTVGEPDGIVPAGPSLISQAAAEVQKKKRGKASRNKKNKKLKSQH